MSQFMDWLRAPVFGVIVMIILMAGVLISTIFAALMAQMSLLFRLRPWNHSEKRTESGKEDPLQQDWRQSSSARGKQNAATVHRQGSPQVVVMEPDGNEVVDAVWWETVQQ